ncbi:hypothetical protein LWI29_035203 [Acer saccharum]|uniref:Uncharacterized protein n=1 Tax=Acer saccharum TaxID=4024 RepID=A0AA39W505_ACESA|nr:hypothetical protein LWI29_035203 [Acer saccharum]
MRCLMFGGVYDPSNDQYDHHQKGLEEIFRHGFSTKLSSAGLVYKVLDEVDVVLDVGGVYDLSNDWYDHHQKGFEEIFGHGFSMKLGMDCKC